MSKTVSVKGACQYVFKNGKSKGKKCCTPCRGKYCFKHKETTLLKKKQYYSKNNRKEKVYPKVLGIIQKGRLPTEDYNSLLFDKHTEIHGFINTYYGIQIFLKKMTEEQVINLRDRELNKDAYIKARILLYRTLPIVLKDKKRLDEEERKKYEQIHKKFHYEDWDYIEKHKCGHNTEKSSDDDKMEKELTEIRQKYEILKEKYKKKMEDDEYFVNYFGESVLLQHLKNKFTNPETSEVNFEAISKNEEQFSSVIKKRITFKKFTGTRKQAEKFMKNFNENRSKLITELKDLRRTVDLINESKIKLLEVNENNKIKKIEQVKKYELKPIYDI
jgi:hypothetical protein